MSKRVAAVVDGKHVTAKMMVTLASLVEPRNFSAMPDLEQNRVRALQDKGLAMIKAGAAVATGAGRDLVARRSRT